MTVCGYTRGPQNNWLITQFINNTLRRLEIFLEVKFYIYGQCEDCQIGFDIFILQTNQSDKNFVRNISVFGSHPTFTLTNNVRDGRTLVNRVLRIEANLDTTGLYVAFRDRGACVYLSEVTVFYPVCDKVSLDFGAC